MRLLLGDCLDKLKELDDNSIDSIVTDPPYGLSFMAKQWDYDVPSQQIWEECMRVLKPGGHLLSFAGSRTYHRMAIRIEDAGFEIRDQLMWIYGSGFPKSMNIGLQLDKKLGNEREVVGKKNGGAYSSGTNNVGIGQMVKDGQDGRKTLPTRGDDFGKITKGNTPYEGWGTALKPAHEPIVMARKPLSEKTVVDNVLEWGTGGINIDGCRVGTEGGTKKVNTDECYNSNGIYGNGLHGGKPSGAVEGRFPANIIFDEEAGKILDEQSGTSKSVKRKNESNTISKPNIDFGGGIKNENNEYNDTGGASRFFYCPKTSKTDRNEGLEEFEEKKSRKWRDDKGMKLTGSGNPRNEMSKNFHPTVKPTDLMLYLIRLVTPKGGTTLDPFMGSGSTGKAAVRGGFDFIGIEREKEYMEIAESRIQYEIDNPYNEEKEERIELNKNSQKFW